MDSDNNKYEVIYCPENDEYRVYSDICDELCIERLHETHLKSPTHTNIRKKSFIYIYKIMSYNCDVCDKTIKLKSTNKQFKKNIHKEFHKCKHIKLTNENLNINNIDEIFYAYIIQHNKKYDYYLINCEFKLDFNDGEFCQYVTSEL